MIDTMKEGGRLAGAVLANFDDCFHLACDFLFLDSSSVIKKQIKLLKNLLDCLAILIGSRNHLMKLYKSS